MTEYKIGSATVRIHGSPDKENLKKATISFLKKVEQQKKEKRRTEK